MVIIHRRTYQMERHRVCAIYSNKLVELSDSGRENFCVIIDTQPFEKVYHVVFQRVFRVRFDTLLSKQTCYHGDYGLIV